MNEVTIGTEQVNITPATPGPTLTGSKIPTVTSFSIGLLIFFLPFLDIKCNNMVLQKVSGVQLATGFNIKGPGHDNSLVGSLEKFDNNSQRKSSQRQSPNTLALAALVLGIAGLFLAIKNIRAGSFVVALLAVAALIATMIDVKSKLKTELLSTRNTSSFGDDNILVTVDFSPGFYLAVLAFIAAAVFSYRWLKTKP